MTPTPRVHRRTVVRTLILALAVGSALFLAPARAAGQGLPLGAASGTLTIDGRAVTLRHAYALAQPNTFDASKTDVAILLTERALPADALKELTDLGHATRGLENYALVEIGEDRRAHYEAIGHAALKEKGLQRSGVTSARFTAVAFGPDRVEGVLETPGAADLLGHRYQLSAKFNAAVRQARRPEPALGPATGQKLPPGGGEPGAAYLATHRALARKDLATFKAMQKAQGAPDLPDEQLKGLLEMVVAMIPADLTLTDGYGKDDRATLYATGKLSGETLYGTITMRRAGATWQVENQKWSNTPTKP